MTRVPEFEDLEALPLAGGERPPAAAAGGAEPAETPLEELPLAQESGAAGEPEALGVHTIADLFELAGDDPPAVAVEGGVYRIQRHAYGRPAGRDPGLRRLAAAVTGGAPPRQDGDPLPLRAGGIDLDRFAAGAPAEGAERVDLISRALHRLSRRARALGAALLVREPSGWHRARQAAGSLRHSAGRLAIAPDDPVAGRYLARRVALIAAAGPPYPLAGSALLAELARRLPAAARGRIVRAALLPARAGGRPAYLLLTAAGADAAWDAPGLAARLGLTAAEDDRQGPGAAAPAP